MALDASHLPGSPQLAGVKVNPRGRARRVGGGVAGAVVGPVAGGIGARIAVGRPDAATASQTPAFGNLAYLAVTDSELALIKLKSGVVHVHLDVEVARIVASLDATNEVIEPHLARAYA